MTFNSSDSSEEITNSITSPGYTTLPNNITECRLGDIKDCDDVTSSQCYSNTTRHVCCDTCQDYEKSIAGCQYGDRKSNCPEDQPYRCYGNNYRTDCCLTCSDLNSGVPGCEWGDRDPNCQSQDCYTYSNNRKQDCCVTCYNPIVTSSSTSSSSTPAPQSSSQTSDNPAWIVPVAGCIGALLLIALVVFIFLWWRRRKQGPQHLSVIDERMYNDYKVSKRAPMALPRDQEQSKTKSLTRQDSAEYAYINPSDIPSSPEDNRRSGNDPLPLPPSAPAQYLELGAADKYGYLEPLGMISKDGSSLSQTEGDTKPNTIGQVRSQTDANTVQYQNEQATPHRMNTYQKLPDDTSHIVPSHETNQSKYIHM